MIPQLRKIVSFFFPLIQSRSWQGCQLWRQQLMCVHTVASLWCRKWRIWHIWMTQEWHGSVFLTVRRCLLYREGMNVAASPQSTESVPVQTNYILLSSELAHVCVWMSWKVGGEIKENHRIRPSCWDKFSLACSVLHHPYLPGVSPFSSK